MSCTKMKSEWYEHQQPLRQCTDSPCLQKRAGPSLWRSGACYSDSFVGTACNKSSLWRVGLLRFSWIRQDYLAAHFMVQKLQETREDIRSALDIEKLRIPSQGWHLKFVPLADQGLIHMCIKAPRHFYKRRCITLGRPLELRCSTQ